VHKALGQLVGFEPGQHATKGVMGRHAMGQCSELLVPLRLGLAIPSMSSRPSASLMTAQGNDENIEQPGPCVSTSGITHRRERVKQARGSRFFHGHSFSKVRVNRHCDQ
jgi:hypothetical protein